MEGFSKLNVNFIKIYENLCLDGENKSDVLHGFTLFYRHPGAAIDYEHSLLLGPAWDQKFSNFV